MALVAVLAGLGLQRWLCPLQSPNQLGVALLLVFPVHLIELNVLR